MRRPDDGQWRTMDSIVGRNENDRRDFADLLDVAISLTIVPLEVCQKPILDATLTINKLNFDHHNMRLVESRLPV